MIPRSSLIIFTDLDGTLLDHQTYAVTPALESLNAVSASRTPLIFCSSKTREEIEVWRKKLDNTHPFISENGGAIFFPPDSPFPESAHRKNDYYVVELGISYGELKARFEELKKCFGDLIRGFSEMDVAEVSKRTGLKQEDALRAQKREYTEPFIFEGSEAKDLRRLEQAIVDLNLNLTRGGRFYHLLAENDKGKAVRITAEAYRAERPNLRTVALGDSANDIPMLEAVDIAILVQKPGGVYDPAAANVSNIRKARGTGPAGWNHAVLQVLSC